MIKCAALRGRYLIDGKRQDGKTRTAGLTRQYIEIRSDQKTNTLTTVQKDNLIVSTDSKEKRHLPKDLKYRKLTPTECERLQTMPDNFTKYGYFSDINEVKQISNTSRYKAIGNSWTINVLSHIFKSMRK